MSETTFTTEDEIAAQSVVEDHRAILATLHVVGSLAWFSGILGPLTSAAIVAVEYGLDCSHPSRDNGATLIERLVQRLNQQFEHSKVLDISSRLSAYGFFERALYERMAAIAEGEADNDDFLTAALEPGGYQTQLLNLLGAAGDNLMSLAFRLLDDPDLSLNNTQPFENRTGWNIAHQKLLTLQLVFKQILEAYMLLLVIDATAYANRGHAVAIEHHHAMSLHVHRDLGARIKAAHHHLIWERRRRSFAPIRPVPSIEVVSRRLDVQHPKASAPQKAGPIWACKVRERPGDGLYYDAEDNALYLVIAKTDHRAQQPGWGNGPYPNLTRTDSAWETEDIATGQTHLVLDDFMTYWSSDGGTFSDTRKREQDAQQFRTDLIEHEVAPLLKVHDDLFALFSSEVDRVQDTSNTIHRRYRRQRLERQPAPSAQDWPEPLNLD